MKSFFSSLAGCVTFLSLLASTQAASNSTNGLSCGVAKPDDSYFSVIGVQGTGVHPRQELRELEKDTELWNIFLQAFTRFQGMSQDEKISYYQIAGIHGAPFQKWDNVAGTQGHEKMGYCPHTSSIFGTWHRPYLALFEQILHDRAVDVANEYPIGEARNKALELADRVRLPYWDWAQNPPNPDEGVIPSNLRRQMAKVTFPNGTTGEITNPLYRYDYHPLKYDDFAPLSEFEFKDWNRTIRYPENPYAMNATSRNDDVNVRIGKQQPNLRDMLYKLLTTYQPFMQLSNKASGGTIGNLETLHDGLHNAFGLGHMGIIEMSAFDPVFWFHHCNVDRILAIYQARYPDTWIEKSEQPMGSFTVARGEVLGPASPLAPFHMNALGDMWTSTTVRNWTLFGYTYPELANDPSNSTLTSSINRLYKPQTQGLGNSNSTVPAPPGHNSTTNGTAQATDWLCEVHMPTDIKISYSVRAFLGKPSSNPKNWATDANYVGQLASMSSPRMNSSVITSGSIALTEKLAQKHASGELASLDKQTVKAYLKENFTWRIQALDYSEISRKNPPKGLNVTVFNVPVSIPTEDDEVPTWTGDVEYEHDIEGNPPSDDDTAASAGGESGVYNAEAGEFEWKKAPDNGPPPPPASGPAVVTEVVEVVATEYVTVGAEATSTAEKEVSTTLSEAEKAPETTAPVDPKTAWVTSVVLEYVTV